MKTSKKSSSENSLFEILPKIEKPMNPPRRVEYQNWKFIIYIHLKIPFFFNEWRILTYSNKIKYLKKQRFFEWFLNDIWDRQFARKRERERGEYDGQR